MTAVRDMGKEPWLAVPSSNSWPTAERTTSIWGNEWSSNWNVPAAVDTKKIAGKTTTENFSNSWTMAEEKLAMTLEQSLKISSADPKKKKKSIIEGEAEKLMMDEEMMKQNLYKTELCRSYVDTGVCRYGHKCQFAHGEHELRPVFRHPKYKTENCKTYMTTGHCPYGPRCCFIHPGCQWSNSWNSEFEDQFQIESSAMNSLETNEEKEKRLSFFKRLAS